MGLFDFNTSGLPGASRNRWELPEFPPIMNYAPSINDLPAVEPAPQRASFFGPGGTGRGIAGLLGDVLLQQGGMQPVYAPTAQQRQQMEFEEQQRQRKRMEGREDEIWKRENLPSAPTQTDRYLSELEDPNTPPQRKAMLRQILLRPIGVPVYGPDGSQKTEFYYPDQMPMGQQGGDDEWEYIDEGGASQGGAPRFR